MGEDTIMQDSPPPQQGRYAFSPWSDATGLMATPAQVARFMEVFQQADAMPSQTSLSTSQDDFTFSSRNILPPFDSATTGTSTAPLSSHTSIEHGVGASFVGGSCRSLHKEDAQIPLEQTPAEDQALIMNRTHKVTSIFGSTHGSDMQSRVSNPFKESSSGGHVRDPANVPARATLMGLPGEIRNEVYEQVLEGDEVIDINSPFPPITRVCQQLRAETMPIYFDFHIFKTTFKSPDDDKLHKWLDILEGIGFDLKQTFRHIRITCISHLLGRREDIVCRHHHPSSYKRVTEFIPWDRLIKHLRSAGFGSEQVDFDSGLRYYYNKDPREDPGLAQGNDLPPVKDLLKQEYLFRHFVLSPLLRIHGLYDPEFPPDAFLKIMLRAKIFQDSAAQDQISRMALSAAQECAAPPELWFEQYALSLPRQDLAEMRAVVEEECARSLRERLAAPERGPEAGHLANISYRSEAGLSRGDSFWGCKECYMNWSSMHMKTRRLKKLG